jgi:hypothetical protein
MSTSDEWSSFNDDLVRPVQQRQEEAKNREALKAPSARTAGIDWDGNKGELRTGPVSSQPADWTALIIQWGLDPDEIEIDGNVRRSSWEMLSEGETVTLNSYRASLRRKTPERDFDTAALLDLITKHKPSKKTPEDGDLAFVVCTGDTQLGKEGTEATISRFLASLDSVPARLKELRKSGRSIGPIFAPWLGDCIEHVTGSYASQASTTELTLTEQIRVIRRLAWKQIEVLSKLTNRLVVPVAPGNHDQAVRSGNKQSAHQSDSFSNDMASYLYDLVSANPAAYGHVEIVVPTRDSLVITQDMCGTMVAMAHGHQFPGGTDGAMRWWAGQAHGVQPAGEATLLLAAHKHHLHVKQDGVKTLVQIPALDSGSSWWTNITGQESPAGIVTLVVGQGSWRDLAVL